MSRAEAMRREYVALVRESLAPRERNVAEHRERERALDAEVLAADPRLPCGHSIWNVWCRCDEDEGGEP